MPLRLTTAQAAGLQQPGTKARRAPVRHEDPIHKSIVDLFQAVIDPAEVLWFHVPNGELRDKATAAKLKAMGVLPGVGDFGLSWVCPARHLLRIGWIEAKALRGPMSSDQETFRDRVTRLGHFYRVARSVEEALAILAAWEVPHRSVRVSA